MKKKVCIDLNGPLYDIKLEQNGVNKFIVTYGKQVTINLTYADAASELGACIMHALACHGNLDNSLEGEE